MSHDDYYISDIEEEGIMWVEDECSDCEYEISQDADVWFRDGLAHYLWNCPTCGHENEWTVEFE